jgi:hypothetical protein
VGVFTSLVIFSSCFPFFIGQNYCFLNLAFCQLLSLRFGPNILSKTNHNHPVS